MKARHGTPVDEALHKPREQSRDKFGIGIAPR
jgi:hypothetical protein